ncbi:MAG: tRNA (adenosine(37)-N6)-threonylcarbamoyltransferase complex transferase subunit TsaD [Candidatus Dojkabacteria bacterium]|nr:tRNA (adenosine(37)-N6)-threonylcarbamoyltransferase complex transferase subunit TsaD [Candidatus Dojkabacteria bacterium]
MWILAIDTSCDDTSAAVVHNDCVISNVISSQIKYHQKWGGVVPSIARRKHQELIDKIVDRALKLAGKEMQDMDLIAVTQGPGLAIALEVGIKKAKELATQYNKPIIPINHMEGHIYSTVARNRNGKNSGDIEFPALVILLSGNHTEFHLMRNHGDYELLGETLDDAIGECFDKVGRILDLGYPAGPVIENLAKSGDPYKYDLPIPMANSKDLNVSYSGLKTAAMKLAVENLGKTYNEYGKKFVNQLQKSTYDIKLVPKSIEEEKQIICDICATFQRVAFEQIFIKISKAIDLLRNQNINIKTILVGGGVSRNMYLRKELRRRFKKYKMLFPQSKKLCTDNAAMIGVAAFYKYEILNSTNYQINFDREPNQKIYKIK